jgi:lactoylglutathione lyase
MLQDLAYTIVYVDDVEKSTAFYRDVLGIPLEYSVNGWTQFKSNGASLVLHPKTDASSAPGGRVRMTFRVLDIDGIYRNLSERGVSFLAPPATASFGKHATLFDPDGNAIDLIEWKSTPSAEVVSDQTTVNDVLVRSPEAMEVLEEHGIRICGGCIVLLNGSVRETAEYSGLSSNETSELVEELNEKLHGPRTAEQQGAIAGKGG